MNEKRCYGCMNLKSKEPVCEHCGYDERTENAPHQLPAGTVLKEQYLIGKVLGQGGFGITYLGWDMYLDIPVAIKEYFPNGTVMRESAVSINVSSCSGDIGAKFQNNKERFMREAKMLARFSQVPEIVQIKNFFLANNTAYIVMEYIKGITLKQYVKEHGGKLSVEKTFEILKPVAVALCKVHKGGLVHRDISPDNIMMLPEGGVKLLDFGAVRDVGAASVDQPLTKSTEAILKQGYAPIEQYQNRGSLGPWTDIYALCATIYYCLTGQVPPDAPERLLSDENIDWKTLVPELTEAQVEALRQGMALRTQDRILSMEELCSRLFETEPKHVDDMEAIEDGQPENITEALITQEEKITSEQTGNEENRETKPSRLKKIIIAALAILAVLIIIAIAFMGGDREAEPAAASDKETDIKEEQEEPAGEQTKEEILEGQCGENVFWTLELGIGRLTISGEGPMDDFNGTWYKDVDDQEDDPEKTLPPWTEYRDKIRSLVIEEGVTSIGDNSFENCHNLSKVLFGEGLTYIGWQAFLSTDLRDVELPDGLREIASDAFNYCVNLKTVACPYSLELINCGAFGECTSLERIAVGENTVFQVEERTRAHPFIREDGSNLENVVIYGYTGSPAESFANEQGFAFVSIGDSSNVKLEGQCGDDVTWRLDLSEKTLYLEGTGDTWLYRVDDDERADWGLRDWPEDWLHYGYPDWYPYRESVEHIVIGEGITSLNHRLFTEMPNLKTVDLGTVKDSHVTFENCGMEEIVFPETMTNVGEFTVQNCESLKKATILGGSSGVREGLFHYCTSLEEVYFSKEAVITGDILDEDNPDPWTRNSKLVFYVYEGSDAYRYAKEYGIPYKLRTD